MKLNIAILLISLASCTFAEIWTNCGSSSDHLHIGNVVITPDPPVRGKELTVAFNATLDETISAGEINLDVKYGFITILKKTLPLCSIIQPYQPCPVKAGPISRSISESIPSAIPGGHYSIHVTANDQNSQELGCIQIDIHW